MNKNLSIVLVLICCLSCFSQERFLQYSSKDTIKGQPKVKGSIGINLKLNGYYDVFGGLQDSETFNIGNINVFETDDSGNLKVDLYQSQINFQSAVMTEKGEKISAVVEFDFWGGNGHMRLRKAYVAFNHWLIGQSWVQFGDDELWPNIMEWEGPPSGIWVRAPQVTYFNAFNNKKWNYTLSLTAPNIDYDKYGDLEPLVEEANQTTPDFTAAIKYQQPWGHLRLSSVFRNVNYIYDNEKRSFFGYGFAFSGIYVKDRNNFQFQLTGGEGVSTYNTSVQGFGYDGYPTSNGDFDATPSFGGWASYELFYSPKFHSTFVLGYTRYQLKDSNRFIVGYFEDEQIIVLEGDAINFHHYAIVNLMYDPFERMSFGVELDYGNKKVSYNGAINNQFIDDEQARDAMRISFGFMYAF